MLQRVKKPVRRTRFKFEPCFLQMLGHISNKLRRDGGLEILNHPQTQTAQLSKIETRKIRPRPLGLITHGLCARTEYPPRRRERYRALATVEKFGTKQCFEVGDLLGDSRGRRTKTPRGCGD